MGQLDQILVTKTRFFNFNEIFKSEICEMDRRALCPKRRNDGKTEAVRKNSRVQNNSARNQRKNDFNMRRRGITNLADVTEDQGDMAETGLASTSNQPNEATTVQIEKKKEKAPLRDRLQEYRKENEEKKKVEEKTKKAPWRGGGVANGFTFKKEVQLNKRRDTYTGRPNRTMDVTLTRRNNETNTGLPKPNIREKEPEILPQQDFTEEFNQINISDRTFEKEEPAIEPAAEENHQIPKTPSPRPNSNTGNEIGFKTPTIVPSETVENMGFKTPTIINSDTVGEIGFRTPTIINTKNETFIKVTPKVTAMVERGTNSDKRRQKCGKTPGRIPAEILQLDEFEPEVEPRTEPEANTSVEKETKPEVIVSAPEAATGTEPDTEKKDVNYFKNMVEDNTKELTEKCKFWEKKLEKIPKTLNDFEDTCGTIRSTIGKANLLMNKKGRFEQFRSLIHNCEFGLGEKETTCMDLQGFWDMIYFQVEDVNSKFSELEDLEAKNWISEPKSKTKINAVKKPIIVSKPFKPKAKASSNLKAVLAAKRKAAMNLNKENDNPQIPQVVVTDAEVEPPKKTGR